MARVVVEPLYALCYSHFMLYVTGLARICLKDSARIWLKSHCFACRYGPSQRGYEPATVVDSGTGRGPGQATYVGTACFEGVTSGESAAGRPCEPSRLGLFVLVTVTR